MNGKPDVQVPRDQELADLAQKAIRLAQTAPGGISYAVIEYSVDLPADPISHFTAAENSRTLLWDDRGWMLASGIVAEETCDGPGRGVCLAAAQARFTALTLHHPAHSAHQPLLLTAWSFEETPPGPSHWGQHLPGGRLWLAQYIWRRDADGHGFLRVATEVRADDTIAAVRIRLSADQSLKNEIKNKPPLTWPPLSDNYREVAEDAITLLRDGALKKAVLARAVDVEVPSHVHITTLLQRLRSQVSDGMVYAYDLDDGGVFAGVTPEILFAADGTRVSTMALAGSAPNDGQDRRSDLLESTKQRKEHGLVVEHIVQILRPRCQPFSVPSSPHAHLRGGLIHLESLIAADLLRIDYVDLLTSLHPTPAVCGLPTATAAHWLARRERLHRGLYAGVIGWLSNDACHFIVPLRGGIIRDKQARLFAGAGLVETSDPDDELAETELKLAVMRRALLV